jgi:hypothetical protein
MLVQRGTESARPLQQVGEAVPAESGPHLRFLPTDAGLPADAHFAPRPNVPDCTDSDLTAVLDLAGERLLITPRAQQACLLPDDLRVTVPDQVTVVQDRQPAVPNPPDFGGQFVHSPGVALNARWSGPCERTPTSGTLTGTGLSLGFTTKGTPASCGAGEETLHLGPAHNSGGPGAVVPEDRADLEVTLQLPKEVRRGAPFDYRVAVANPSDHDVALRPCPTFATSYQETGHGGGGSYGRLPCAQLPDVLHARQQIVVLMTGRTQTVEPATAESRTSAELTWQISGTDPATGRLEVVDRPPKALAPVPYLSPSGASPAPSTFRYTPGNGAFPVVIEGPASVRVGEVLRYKAVFTNSGGPVVPLRPCPGWTELVAQAPKVTNRPKIIERSGVIDCVHAPDQVNPGEQIAFEMERVIGTDTPPGAYQVYWQIHNGMTSAPFDLEVLP